MSAENEVETPRGGIADREDESALRHELARLRQRVLELEAAQAQAGQSRVALLNALEDAVAAQRRAETATVALQHSEERLQLILDSAEDFAIFTLDCERRITSWNRGAELIFGYGPEEARSCRGDILFTPEDQARGAPSAEADQALTEGRAENERWHVRRDGSRFYGSGVTRPLRIGMNVVGFVKALRDLTPWVTADKARREAEARLRAVANVVPDLLWHSESDGANDWCNERWLQYTGQTLAEAIGWGWTDAIHADDREGTIRAYVNAVKTGSDLETECRVRSAGGRYRWFLVRGKPLKDELGRLQRMFVSATDIDAIRTAEDKLRQREQFITKVLDSLPSAVVVLDERGTILTVNEQWRQLGRQHGASATLLAGAGANYLEVCRRASQDGDDTAGRALAGLQQVITGERSDFTMEYCCETNHRLRWFALHCFQPAEGLRGAMVTHTDITPQMQAEEALRESGERIRRALTIETVGVVFFRLRGNIVAANGAFARMSGYTEEQLRVLGPWESLLIHDEHFDVTALKSDLESRGHAAPFETQLSRPDGRRWWALTSPTRLSSSGPNPECVAFVVDISTSKEAQAALEQALAETERARTEAESAARAKDQFLAILSHELRTPLTPVLLASHMLLRQADLSENTRDLLESIQRNVQTEAQLVDDLLDVTRIAHGKLEISLTPLNLHEVLTKAIGVSEGDIEGKQQRLGEDISAALDTFVLGDSRRLQQAFWNLLKNASKFTPHAGELTIRCRVESDTAIVQISDSGIGFDSEAAERIFAEFEQANRLVTQEYGGLGLGLGISKAAVEAHGGSIRGESRGPGKGATFSVTLPLLKQ